jgi:hypothetical protein
MQMTDLAKLLKTLPMTSALVSVRDIIAETGMSPEALATAVVAGYREGSISPHAHDFPAVAAKQGAILIPQWDSWIIGIARRS